MKKINYLDAASFMILLISGAAGAAGVLAGAGELVPGLLFGVTTAFGATGADLAGGATTGAGAG
jgi:hypothetical protein